MGLWEMSIEENVNGNRKSITETKKAQNFDARPTKLEHAGINLKKKNKKEKTQQERTWPTTTV